MDALDANIQVFGKDNTQVLEYWLDVSRIALWQREKVAKLPWKRQHFLKDLRTYARRGIGNITTFAVWFDRNYIKHFGQSPLNEYGSAIGKYPATPRK